MLLYHFFLFFLINHVVYLICLALLFLLVKHFVILSVKSDKLGSHQLELQMAKCHSMATYIPFFSADSAGGGAVATRWHLHSDGGSRNITRSTAFTEVCDF